MCLVNSANKIPLSARHIRSTYNNFRKLIRSYLLLHSSLLKKKDHTKIEREKKQNKKKQSHIFFLLFNIPCSYFIRGESSGISNKKCFFFDELNRVYKIKIQPRQCIKSMFLLLSNFNVAILRDLIGKELCSRLRYVFS